MFQPLFPAGSTLRLWTVEGECVGVLSGHTSYIYSVCVLPSGLIASSGEDSCVRLWSLASHECTQTITLPCISVWAVATLPNGDLAVRTLVDLPGSSTRLFFPNLRASIQGSGIVTA